MTTSRFQFGQARKLPPWLFADTAGGIQISGDSGSGKSNLMAVLMQALAARGQGFCLLDPHGDLARQVQRYCLHLGNRVMREVYFVCPAETTIVTPLHPLSLDADDLDEYTRRARLSVKVAHVARILLHAWGERDFNSKPLLFKWTTRLLRTLAMLGLSLADVRHFLSVQSPLYHVLVEAVPDLMARTEFAELAYMRPSDREDLIASTKNRFLGFLENAVVEAAVSRVEGVMHLRSLMQRQAIILVDLAPRGVLREEDQEILANLWLNELLHAVYNTPQAERVPYFLFIDELPVFASCGPQLSAALRQIRKMQLRIVAAHQGTQFLPERQDDPLLHAFIGQCGTHFYFRHCDPVDAKFFGEVVALPSLDLLKVKHELKQIQQYQEGNDLVVLTDEGESVTATDTKGGGETHGTTQASSWSADTSSSTANTESIARDRESLRETVSQARAEVSARRSGEGGSAGTRHDESKSWSRAQSQGHTRTRKQTLVPRLKWRDVIMSVQFYTSDEQMMTAASRMASKATGLAFMHLAGQAVAEVTIPLAKDPYRMTPAFAKKKEAAYVRELYARPEYALPAVIEEERRLLLEALLRRLPALAPAEILPSNADGTTFVPGSKKRSPRRIGVVQNAVETPTKNTAAGNGEPDSPITI